MAQLCICEQCATRHVLRDIAVASRPSPLAPCVRSNPPLMRRNACLRHRPGLLCMLHIACERHQISSLSAVPLHCALHCATKGYTSRGIDAGYGICRRPLAAVFGVSCHDLAARFRDRGSYSTRCLPDMLNDEDERTFMFRGIITFCEIVGDVPTNRGFPDCSGAFCQRNVRGAGGVTAEMRFF